MEKESDYADKALQVENKEMCWHKTRALFKGDFGDPYCRKWRLEYFMRKKTKRENIA